MYASPGSDSPPKSGKLVLIGFIISIAIVILIASGSRITDYFSSSENHTDDLDNDGVPNDEDAFPRDPNEWIDTDGDGIGDNADIDKDNDDIKNENDYLPYFDAALNISLQTVRILGAVDTPPFDSPAEVFFIIYLDDEELVTAHPSGSDYWEDVIIDTTFPLNWYFIYNVPDDQSTFDLRIELYDQDSFSSEQLDIDGTFDGDFSLDLHYKLQTGGWWGDDTDGMTTGTDDEGKVFEKDAQLTYSISTIPAPMG
jgi:hypothetical protein